jgi:hypothetical protein
MKKDNYKNLKELLDKIDKWPSPYMFKFICPNTPKKIDEVKKNFDLRKFTFKQKESKDGKFTSLTFVAVMSGSNTIISKYRSLEMVDGLIAL